MKLAIVSDTHVPRGHRTIPAACLERAARADAILHAGDLTSLHVFEQLTALGPPVLAIHGNVDGPEVRAHVPETREDEFAGARIAMIHDPGPKAGRLERLQRRFPLADAVIFGHTHLPEHQEQDGFQIFNPGSPTERRRAPSHTMGEATVAHGRIAFALIDLDRNQDAS
jgi:putative phosphoesterase